MIRCCNSCDSGGAHDGVVLRESILHLKNLSKACGLDRLVQAGSELGGASDTSPIESMHLSDAPSPMRQCGARDE